MSAPITRRRFLSGTAAAVAAPVLLRPDLVGAAAGVTPPARLAPDVLTGWIRAVYPLVKSERILPPAAARVYAYIALAGYEATVGGMPHHRSLGGRLNGFAAQPGASGMAWQVSVNEACAAAAAGVFGDRTPASIDAIDAHLTAERERLVRGLAPGLVERSRAHGRRVGAAIVALAASDGYAETRNLPYTPPVGPAMWVRTPPNFGAAIEPHWGRVRSFTLLSNDECKPPAPIPFSEVAGSAFWQQANTVYETGHALDDTRRATAMFWRDNPDGSTGLPSGHWMQTACTAIDVHGLDLGAAAEVLALTGMAIADGFTSCWTEKYETNLLRPVTYIQRVIDPTWNSFVNSPAFPEYTSGHSVGSAAAAHVLTTLLGDVTYDDDVGLQNGYPLRRFTSFGDAAREAAISRLYGGIHYPMAIEVGLEQGRAVAARVLERARTRR